jgi:hypothetical protein
MEQAITTDPPLAGLTTEDRLDLLSLPARYGNAMDDRDWAALRSIFTPDAVFVVLQSRTRLEGIDRIVTYMDATAYHPLSHMTVNAAIDLHGEDVGVRFRGLLPIAEGDAAPEPSRVAFGFYYDTVVKTPDGWRVRNRLFLRSPRDMKPTPTDVQRQHGLMKLHEADQRDIADWPLKPF